MFDSDSRLLSALATKPQSIAEVIGALERIDAICVDHDGLKWFNWLYLRVTRAVSETYHDNVG